MALMMLRLGNITSLLSKIRPAVEKANSSYKGNKSSKNDDFMGTVCHFNVHISIDEIKTKSPIL